MNEERKDLAYKDWDKKLEGLRKSFDTSIPDILEPPCKACAWFHPRYTTQSDGKVNGIVLCAKSQMLKDFTCYERTR